MKVENVLFRKGIIWLNEGMTQLSELVYKKGGNFRKKMLVKIYRELNNLPKQGARKG